MQVDRLNTTEQYKLPDQDIHETKLDQCINSIIKKQGYITYDVTRRIITPDGGNYLGVLCEVDVKGKTVNGEQTTAIFIKTMTPDHVDMELLSLEHVYEVELFFYKNLGKVFEEVQNEANIPEDERYLMVKAYEESYPEALFLENITRKGFKTWKRMDIVTLEFAEVAIKQLARFHGLSFALQMKRPQYFNDVIKKIKNPMVFGESWYNFTKTQLNLVLEHLKDDEKKEDLENILIDLLPKYETYHLDETTRYCLCHGDYRPNNILVKETEGVVTEAIPVDFQVLQFGCPVLDFIYFIYTATDYKFRKQHLNYLKDLYYSSLEDFLMHFNIDAKTVFPKETFEKLHEEKRDYGLIISVLILPFIFTSQDTIPDITKSKCTDWRFVLHDKFKERFGGDVKEFTESGFL